ncbi:MAG: YbhN family protein [Acidimicrobiales bacterium]
MISSGPHAGSDEPEGDLPPQVDVAPDASGAPSLAAASSEEPTRPGGPAVEGIAVRPARSRRRFHIPRFLRRGATIIVMILVLEYLVIPKLTVAFSHKSLHRLEAVNPWLIILAFGLEVISLFAYAELTVVVLPPNSLSLSKAWRINLASLTVSHVIPAGTAGGTTLSIRLMTSEGLSVTDVGFATAIEGIGSAVLLNVMLWLAIVISIPFNGFNPTYVTVAIVSVLLLGFFAALIAGFSSGEGWAVKALRKLARRVRFIPEEKLERAVRQIAERLQAAAKNPELIRRGVAWAAANWLFDAACLYICLWALHYPMNPVDVFVAYGVGNVLAAIPITPGGLGITEGGVIAVLTAFGVPVGIGTLAVIGWRFFNFWLPIPVGAVAYLTLTGERGVSLRERRTVLSSMTEVARNPRPPDGDQDKGRRPPRRGSTDPKAGPAVPPLG